MRIEITVLSLLLTSLLCFSEAFVASADTTPSETAGLLPDTAGGFKARGGLQPSNPSAGIIPDSPEEFGVLWAASRRYVSSTGDVFVVTLFKTGSDKGAYALLTHSMMNLRLAAGDSDVLRADIGTQGATALSNILFFKGSTVVSIEQSARVADGDGLKSLARAFAETLDAGDNEIPPLVKHLPDAESVQGRALYAITLSMLKKAAGDEPVFEAISFEGGTEAVSAAYGQARLVIVEYTTPQIATVNDTALNEKLNQLRNEGGSLPTLYRRIGNYSVFVFDALSEADAAQLVENIKYEQVVRWLGVNPNALRRAEIRYAQMTASVILAVFQATGLALVLCIGAGALAGFVLFRSRRKQQADAQAFSDAGGTVRLNIDDLAASPSKHRLLKS